MDILTSNEKSLNDVISKINQDGFVILRNAIKNDLILKTRSFAADFLECEDSPNTILKAMEELETTDKSAFHEFCIRMTQVPPLLSTGLNTDFMKIAEEIIKSKNIHLADCGVFYNKLSVKRLQYNWHQENAYFPKATEVLTLWYPWLHPVNKMNGTMVMAKGGHKKKFETAHIRVKNGLTQEEISETDLSTYEKVHCELELGDAVLFSFNAPHRTGHNSTNTPRSSIIIRYADKIGKYYNGWEQ